MQTWTNWGGNQTASPSSVVTPGSVDELASVVRGAAARGARVKPIGSGHSFTAIGCTDGVQLDLSRLAGLRALDRASGLVTVEAGMPLHRLNQVLDMAGLALRNLGDIDRQTISGAISTGTHGTGARLGGIATQVRALEMVLADGSVVQADAQLLAAARVGLGALGVITAVTLEAVPAFLLHAVEQPMPIEGVLAELDELVATNEHFEFYWFPHTGSVLTKRNNRVDGPVRPLGRARAALEDELLANGVFRLTCELGRRVPALVPRINAVAGRLMGDREFTDVSHQVFCSPRRVRFVEMEYAVPRAAILDAVAGVRRVCEGRTVSFPIEVRFAAADDIPLSTASGRDSAYVAVHMFAGQPHEAYFREVEAVMGPLGGRPHWGKMHGLDAATLRERYPRFDEFRAVRDRVDPGGVFRNSYLDRVLG